MFDVAPSELLLVGFVALVVIGPKDLPKAMRVVGYWVGRGRGVMRQVRSGFDTMMREAELKELEEKWAQENARIMRETALVETPAIAAPAMMPLAPAPTEGETAVEGDAPPELTPAPVLTGPPPPTLDEIDAALGLHAPVETPK
ncbi:MULTISPECIES: Sec-independent protein translocase protein TatB [Sphingomonas]|uniref:Sec-independent protein translocase protein TatB n=1 Tax=Sphingomonas TaxID=13687 RepID=UPI0009EB567C|nr:Sec-independent protein translocase protein TatB [Sphingomonas sp. CCH10-B3]MBA3879746.1 twin-arginine translocase subunit TatB [Sphingobium sp.]